MPGYHYTQKETFVNRTDDIESCFPKKLIRENISRSVFNLNNDDIKGTKPQINKFISTRQCNPLAPEYKLPSAVIKIASPPKFIRDNISISVLINIFREKLKFLFAFSRILKEQDQNLIIYINSKKIMPMKK